MSIIFLLALVGLVYYFLRRRANPERATIWSDIKSLFRRAPQKEDDFEQPAHDRLPTALTTREIIRVRDGHSIESDPGLTDAERIEEIMGLTDLFNRESGAETKGREEQ